MKLVIDPNELRPLVQDIVSEIVATLPITDEPRLAWREDEAARLVGMARHQLRDRRLEGRIRGVKIGRCKWCQPTSCGNWPTRLILLAGIRPRRRRPLPMNARGWRQPESG